MAFWLAVAAIAAVCAVWWSRQTPEQRAAIIEEGRRRRDAKRAYDIAGGKRGHRRRLSEVGVRGPAGLACPRCGGTHFDAGLGRVRCVTCGARFNRG